PQQQALAGLQNSISAAQASQGQQVGSTSTGQGVRRNVPGQSQLGGSAGRRGQGRGNAAKQGPSSAHGHPTGGAAARPGTSSSSGRSSGMMQRPGYYGGDGDPMNR